VVAVAFALAVATLARGPRLMPRIAIGEVILVLIDAVSECRINMACISSV
jgi:hypothetical protein